MGACNWNDNLITLKGVLLPTLPTKVEVKLLYHIGLDN